MFILGCEMIMINNATLLSPISFFHIPILFFQHKISLHFPVIYIHVHVANMHFCLNLHVYL